jgi:hypothetical protein
MNVIVPGSSTFGSAPGMVIGGPGTVFVEGVKVCTRWRLRGRVKQEWDFRE